MKLGVKELIELCIYCWGHPLLNTFSGSVAVWMLLSGNLQQGEGLLHPKRREGAFGDAKSA